MIVLAKLRRKCIKKHDKQVAYLPFLKPIPNNVSSKLKAMSSIQQKIVFEKRQKKKAKTKKVLNVLTFVFSIAVLAGLLIYQLSTQGVSSVTSPPINWNYLGITIGIVVAIIVIDALKYYVLILKATKKSRPFLSYKVSTLGRYYDNVTPMSTGGQPFQMMYMNKRGVRGDIATSIPLMKYIIWQITYVIICTFSIIFSTVKYGMATGTVTTTLAWIAIIVNVLTFLTIIMLSISRRVGPKIVIWTLRLLAKMHIVKNYQKTFRKVMRFVVNYQKTFKFLLKSPVVLLSELIFAASDIILTSLIPYFVCLSFVDKALLDVKGLTMLKCFIQSIVLSLSTGFIPTPGASGGAEAFFVAIFSSVLGNEVFWPTLIWRIMTYYIYLLQGLVVLVYDFVIGNKKAEKLKKQGAKIYAEDIKPTFRETLQENRKTIDVVQNQEQDKIAITPFTELSAEPEVPVENIIQNSDIVSESEMKEKIYQSEQMLKEVQLKEISKQKDKESKMEKKACKKKNSQNCKHSNKRKNFFIKNHNSKKAEPKSESLPKDDAQNKNDGTNIKNNGDGTKK